MKCAIYKKRLEHRQSLCWTFPALPMEACGSDPITLKLPHTKLEFTLPLAIYMLPGNNPDRGIIPDILTVHSIEDYQNHRDNELDKVRELIKKEKIGKSEDQ